MTRASITDPHLLRAQVVGSDSGDARLRLEKLEAPTLAQVLGEGPMPPRTAVALVVGLARAAASLEASGLVVRDLVPERVLLDDSRGAVLAEHGIPPQVLPLKRPEPDPNFTYRAPEDRERGELSARASVYALGAILLAALTGKTPPALIRQQQESPSRDLPRTLGSVIARSMSHDPGGRYEGSIEMARAAVEALRASERLGRSKPVRMVAWKRAADAPTKAALTLTRQPTPDTPTRTPKPAPDQEQQRAEAAKREAAETAEREAAKRKELERKAAAAAERQAARDAGRERKAIEAAERETAKRAEAERKAAAAAEREAARAAERERKAAEAAERAAAKSAERERKAAEVAARKQARKDAREADDRRRAAEARRKRGEESDRAKRPEPAARGRRRRQKTQPARSTTATRSANRRSAPHLKPARPTKPSQAQQRTRRVAAAAPGSPRSSASRSGSRRGPFIFAAVGVLATGAAAIALLPGDEPDAAATKITNSELSMRLPADWKRTDLSVDRFGSLSNTLTAARLRGDRSVLITGAMVEPSHTTAALRRLAPGGTRPEPVRLGNYEVIRYDGLKTSPGKVGAAYVLNTTGPSVLIVCEAPSQAGGTALSACADVASTLRVENELPISLASAKARRPAAYRALHALGAARIAARERLASASLASDQSDAAGDLQVDYYEASRRVEATGLPGASIDKLVAALAAAGDAYGLLADAIGDGDQAAYDRARGAVLKREAAVWALLPPRASQSVGAQPPSTYTGE